MRIRCKAIAVMMVVLTLTASCGGDEPTPTAAPPTTIPATTTPPPGDIPEPTEAATPTPTVTPAPAATEVPPTVEATPTVASVEVLRDVTYVPGRNSKQKLDIYLPQSENGPFPTLFTLHGGYGDKNDMVRLARYFAQRGYAVISINYRDMPQHTFPAPVQDVFCALAWTHANAEAYGFDPERIYALGHSSGGTLAATLGALDDPTPYMESCPHPLPGTARLQGVIPFTGVFDYASSSGGLLSYYSDYLGAAPSEAPELWAEASPITWIDGSEPPFLLIHGAKDRNIDPSHSTSFAAALETAGVPVELLLVPDADHNAIIRSEQTLAGVEAFLSGATPVSPGATVSATPVPTPAGRDGGVIAFYSDRDGNWEIYVMNTDGSDQRRLTHNSADDALPDWSPDGKQIAFQSKRDANWEIYVMNVADALQGTDGRDQRRLTNNDAADEFPSWSPDGTQIAFHSDRDGDAEIYVVDVVNGNLRQLTDNSSGEWQPAWSPDGSLIAFESDRDGNDEIYVMNVDGSNQRRLTHNGGLDLSPAWSPDGTRLAFFSGGNGTRGFDIYVMNVADALQSTDGSDLQQLTDQYGHDEFPTWSPDGSLIAFESDRSGNEEIYVMNVADALWGTDGSGQRRLTDNSYQDYGPDWRPETAMPPSEVSFADASLGDTWTRPADGMTMVYVPGGSFQMGSTESEIDAMSSQCEQEPVNEVYCERRFFEYESPQHAVTLDGFWIDRTEVTNAQYSLCVAAGDCRASRLANNPTYNGEDYPVAGIPWQDAADYCAWVGGRLPTEAEWEYAARGAQGHIYPWGNTFDCAGGNFGDDFTACDDGHAHTAPVGSFPAGASWCGALDLAGNVWEWVSGKHGDYPSATQTNPTGPIEGDLRVLRGGSWGYGWDGVRAAYRYPVPASADYLGVGFRCVVPFNG